MYKWKTTPQDAEVLAAEQLEIARMAGARAEVVVLRCGTCRAEFSIAPGGARCPRCRGRLRQASSALNFRAADWIAPLVSRVAIEQELTKYARRWRRTRVHCIAVPVWTFQVTGEIAWRGTIQGENTEFFADGWGSPVDSETTKFPPEATEGACPFEARWEGWDSSLSARRTSTLDYGRASDSAWTAKDIDFEECCYLGPETVWLGMRREIAEHSAYLAIREAHPYTSFTENVELSAVYEIRACRLERRLVLMATGRRGLFQYAGYWWYHGAHEMTKVGRET